MRSLRLNVALNGSEQLSNPLRRIRNNSTGAAEGLRNTREQLRNLKRTEQTANAFGQTRQNLQRTNQQLTQARERVRELTAAQRRGEGGTKRFAQQMRRANIEVRDLSQRSREQRQRLNEQRRALQQAGISTRQLSHSKRELSASIQRTNQQLAQQQERLRRVGDAQRRNRELSRKHGNEMMRMGMAGGMGFGAMTVGIRAGQGAARLLAPGMDFDSTMSQVQALTRLRADDPALGALRDHARELGASTQFSATDVAGGQAFLAMAGFTPNSIRAAMPGLLDVALASGTDLARTADISSNILGGFNLKASKMPWVADTLTKTFTTSNTTLEMLGETMKYVGPVAQSAGVDLEKTAAMAGLLGNVGIQGSESGTALRAMLLRLSAPTGSAAKTLRALGIRITDENGKLRDMTTLLEEMHWALDSLGDTEQLGILKDVFGERPAAALSELLNAAGDGRLRRYENTISNNQGEAGSTAQTQADNLRGDLAELRSSWDDVRIQLMDENEGMLRNLVNNITGSVRSLGDWVKANPRTVQFLSKVALGLLTVTTFLGGLTVTLVSVLGPMLILRFILARLGLSLLPILGKGLRLVGKAALLPILRFGRLGKGARALGKGLAVLATGPFRLLSRVLTHLSTQIYAAVKAKGLLGAAMGGLRAGALKLGAVLRAGLLLPFKAVGIAIKGLGAALLTNPITWIVAGLAVGAILVVRNWQRVKAFFSGFWQGLIEGFAPVRQSVARLARVFTPLAPLWNRLSAMASHFADWLGRLIRPVNATTEQLQGATRAGRRFGQAVGSAVNWLVDIIGGAFQRIGAAVRGMRDLFVWLKDGTLAQLGALREGWNRFWSGSLTRRVMGALSGVRETLGGFWQELQEAWNGGFISMAKWTGNGLARVGQLFMDFNPLGLLYTGFADLLNWLGVDMPRQFSDAGAALMNGLISGIKNKLGGVRDAVNDIADSTIGWFKEKLGIRSPSRVFDRFGQDTLTGYQQGLQRREGPTLKQMDSLTKRLTAAGAGVVIGGAAALPVAADYRLDTRQPITGSAAPQVSVGGDTIEIHIHAGPGMSVHAVAHQVQNILDQRERDKAARSRSLLHDR